MNTEFTAWTQHIKLWDIIDAITKKITYGVCKVQEEFKSHPVLQSQNIDVLKQGVGKIPISLWQKIHDVVKHWESYMSITVILNDLCHVIKCNDHLEIVKLGLKNVTINVLI